MSKSFQTFQTRKGVKIGRSHNVIHKKNLQVQKVFKRAESGRCHISFQQGRVGVRPHKFPTGQSRGKAT